jgi:antitoxin HicB
LPEFSNCRTHGETYEEAVKNGEEVLDLLIATFREDGKPLPEPHLLKVA